MSVDIPSEEGFPGACGVEWFFANIGPWWPALIPVVIIGFIIWTAMNAEHHAKIAREERKKWRIESQW